MKNSDGKVKIGSFKNASTANLEEDKSVKIINKKLEESNRPKFKWIAKNQHRACKQVEENIYLVNQEVQKIDQLKLEREDTFGLWEQVIAKRKRLIPNTYNKGLKGRQVASAPYRSSRRRGDDNDDANTRTGKNYGSYSARTSPRRRDRSGQTTSRENQPVQNLRIRIRPKTRYISSARYSERNFQMKQPSFGLAALRKWQADYTFGSGTVSQRRLHFLSRSYLELANQVRLDRQKSGRSLFRDLQNLIAPSGSSYYAAESSTPRCMTSSSIDRRTDDLRPTSSNVPLTGRERKLHRFMKKVEVDCANVREKVKEFCEKIHQFVLSDRGQDENQVLDDGYSIGMN